MQPPASYDLITLEPPPIGYAGVASLYSEEFYRLARSRLKPNGFVSQWLPAYQVPTATTLSMIKSFVDVFPESVLLSGAEADLILIGANNRIEIDPNQLFAAMSQRPAARADLARLDLGTPREIVGMFVGSARTLAAATRDAVPVTDDRPVQEFGVRSLLNLGESVPGSVVDLGGVAEWCPKCFDNGAPVRLVEGLDLYLALLNRAYAATPAERCAHPRGGRQRPSRRGQRVSGHGRPRDRGRPQRSRHRVRVARAHRRRRSAEFRQSLTVAARLGADTVASRGRARVEGGAGRRPQRTLRRSVQLDPTNDDAQHDLDTVIALRRQQSTFSLT